MLLAGKASKPSSKTGCFALLIIDAASLIAFVFAGLRFSGTVGVRTSPSVLPFIISIGALIKAPLP